MTRFVSSPFCKKQNLDQKENEQKSSGIGLGTENEQQRSQTVQNQWDGLFAAVPEGAGRILESQSQNAEQDDQ